MDIKTLESFRLSDAISFHDELNPKLWIGMSLRPEVKSKLKVIADDFMDELGISGLDIVDVTISGSNAAYTYTDHSDLDLHILVDMSDMPNDEVYKELFKAKKDLYNDSHNIKIRGVPVELYVQDASKPIVSLGEYSIKNNNWIKLPTKRRANFDQTITRKKYENLLEIIKKAYKSKDYNKIVKVLKKIKQYRQAGLDKGGEFGPENLAYKALRSKGYIEKLYNLRDLLHSEKLSIESKYASEDYDPNGPPPGPEFKPTMPRGTVRVDVSDVYDWYKLGQHISNMKGLGKHDFGKGPPSTIMSFGDEDLEHQYIKALQKTGLSTTDIDPASHKKIKGQKVDPTYNVNEGVAEGSIKDLHIDLQDQQWDAIVGYVINGLNNKMDTERIELNLYKYAGREMFDVDQALEDHGFESIADLADHIQQHNRRYVPPTDFGLTDLAESLRIDVPNENWLQGKIDYAEKKGRDRFGAPYFNATTAYFTDNVRVPIQVLRKLPGMRGEQQNVRQNDLAAIKKILKDTGKLPLGRDGKEYGPFVLVAYNGEAWVSEGNHRIMAAAQLYDEGDMKFASLPVELKYFDGGERIKDGPLYPSKIGFGNQGVAESLDSPYSYHWEEGDFGDLNAYAQLSDDTVLDIEFEQINVDKSQWTVAFQRDGQIHKTGKGDEQRVFATVLSAIKEFIENKQPKEVFFSAEKSTVNPESRKRLYDRLVQKYATALGYQASQSETSRETKYRLSRIREQGLAEASGYIPSEKEKNDPRFKTALTVDVHPNTMKNDARKFGNKISRAGIPPTLKSNGKC